MKPEIQAIDLELDQLEANLDRIEQTLGEEAARPFRLLLNWHLALVRLIEQKNITLRRLRRLLFGATTERTRNVVKEQTPEGQSLEPE